MITARTAHAGDIDELARLRALFSRSIESEFFKPESSDQLWLGDFANVLEQRLGTDSFTCVVIDGTTGLAACGTGTVEQWLPSPWRPTGQMGHVLNVYTDTPYRRRGYSRLIMTSLLSWFADNGVTQVDLHASAEAEHLYRSLGFTDHPDPALSYRQGSPNP